ncbi:hypothetical protein DIPPA_05898 [Diplonema papillatum]|nr:hypothetical protein DIPPA_05898 [Diplonema papillatum]KAJ9448777.1 hypothetical protein DIPPA_05898 [Diplonema papillatum]
MASLQARPLAGKRAVSPGRAANGFGAHMNGGTPGGGRALEVALARAVTYRQAALQQQSETSAVAAAQVAIGRELAELREEVVRSRTNDGMLLEQSRLYTPPRCLAVVDTPDRPAVRVIMPDVSPAWQAERVQLRAEIERLRLQSSPDYSEPSASRLQGDAADWREASASVLRERYRQLSEAHKAAKARLVELRCKTVANPAISDAKQAAEAAFSRIDALNSSINDFTRARDALRSYETQVSLLQATAKQVVDDWLETARSAETALEAKLSAAEVRMKRAEDEMDDMRQHTAARIDRETVDLRSEVGILRQQLEAKERHQADLREKLGGDARTALETEQKAHQERLRHLEVQLREAERRRDAAAAQADSLVASQKEQTEKQQLALLESAESATDARVAALEGERDRLFEKTAELEAEVRFERAQCEQLLDAERKRAREEVETARKAVEVQLRTVERDFSKHRHQSDNRLDAEIRAREQDAKLARQRFDAAELDALATKTLCAEAQRRCDELLEELDSVTAAYEATLEDKARDLREAEARLIGLAQAQQHGTPRAKKDYEVQLVQAESRIVSLSDELSSVRARKGTEAQALDDARRHATSLSDQLSHALKRNIELEDLLGQRDVELQEAGAKASMLEGCLAEATSSLETTEEHMRLVNQTKSNFERAAITASARAEAQETKVSELSSALRELQSNEIGLTSTIAELENRLQDANDEIQTVRKQRDDFQKEAEDLRAELDEIRHVMSSREEAAEATHSYAERVTSLAHSIEEKETQNIGLRRRIQELESQKLQEAGKLKVTEARAEELKQSLHAARLRMPELERAAESHRSNADMLNHQLREMRTRASARAAEAQAAIEKAAMIEGRHREALSRQANLQRQLAQEVAKNSSLDEGYTGSQSKLDEVNNKIKELTNALDASREALRSEGENTARLEGQLSEVASEQTQLQEALRAANDARTNLLQQLQESREERGVLESKLEAARDKEQEYLHRLDTSYGARAEAAAARGRVVGVKNELDAKVSALETKLHEAAQEKGSLSGALRVAEAKIAELKKAAERVHDQSANEIAKLTAEMDAKGGRAAAEASRYEQMWLKATEELTEMRTKQQEIAAERGTLLGELEALRTGTTASAMQLESVEGERDKALMEIARLSHRLQAISGEVKEMEQRASGAASSKGELEGMLESLRHDLKQSQRTAKQANEALAVQKTQSATERAALENHISVLTSGLRDLEYQLQVAASRTAGLEEAVRTSETEALHSIAATSPHVSLTPDPYSSP